MILVTVFAILWVIQSHAQTSTASNNDLSGSDVAGSSIPNFGGDLVPTGSSVSYIFYSKTASIDGSTSLFGMTYAIANDSSLSTSSPSGTSTSFSLLQGSVGASTAGHTNATMSSNLTVTRTTSSSAVPENTQACNNYPELCGRTYSNITYVAAHNSPFVNLNNLAANQELGVIAQLNDGIRMLQGQTHYNATTGVISYCHTSCNLLDAGTAETFFTNVTRWIRTHPYDVVTILIGNADFIGVRNYTTPLENSGLSRYAYVPSQIPMSIASWPTLGSMILMGKRAVIFMDYNANQSEVPYILDEFSHVWETPFSPTNRSFPCTVQRPPGLSTRDAEQRMYMANHNLNTEVSLPGTSLLVPTTTLLNETNAVNGTGSLGLMADDCAREWSRPPNFLLVDFYNQGSSPGSVFEVAAEHNNVTYNRPCCGLVKSAAHWQRPRSPVLLLLAITGISLYATLW